MLIGVHVSGKTKGEGAGERRGMSEEGWYLGGKKICHFVQPSWFGFFRQETGNPSSMRFVSKHRYKVLPVVLCNVAQV